VLTLPPSLILQHPSLSLLYLYRVQFKHFRFHRLTRQMSRVTQAPAAGRSCACAPSAPSSCAPSLPATTCFGRTTCALARASLNALL
jgi:hypothetical protein